MNPMLDTLSNYESLTTIFIRQKVTKTMKVSPYRSSEVLMPAADSARGKLRSGSVVVQAKKPDHTTNLDTPSTKLLHRLGNSVPFTQAAQEYFVKRLDTEKRNFTDHV